MVTLSTHHYQTLKRRRLWYRRLSKPVKMSRMKMIFVVLGAVTISHLFSFNPFSQYIPDVHDEVNPASFFLDSNPIHDTTEVENRKRLERRRRTQPPQEEVTEIIQYELILQSQSQTNSTDEPDRIVPERFHRTLCGPHARAAASRSPHRYPKHLKLGSRAHVVITNILSSAGMHLALKLSNECHVDSILGVDSLLPNTRRNRVDLLERYAMLSRRVPQLKKIITPYAGVLSELDLQKLHSFRPTHIVHLVPEYLRHDDYQLYQLCDKMRLMNQLLEFIQSARTKPYLVYAGPDQLFERILAAFYHRHFNIDSFGLELPLLYGPWGQTGSWAWNAAERILKLPGHLRNSSGYIEDDTAFLYVEDAVDAIVASTQYSSGLVMLDVSSNTTKASLEKALNRGSVVDQLEITDLDSKQPYWQHKIQWMPVVNAFAGVRKLLSWHFALAHPYGRGDYQRKLPTNIKDNFHYQFPCASECSIPGSCIPTAFDAVVRASRKMTNGCKYVLYMVNLSGTIETLPMAINVSSTDTSLCQVAFVSHSSKVGRKSGVYHGWSTLQVKADDSKMTQAEYSLLKLSPSLFFAKTVVKAIFIDPVTFSIERSADVTEFVRSIDAPSQNGKLNRIQRSGTPIVRWEWTKGKAAQVAMLLGHEDPLVNSSESFKGRVQSIADRDGILDSTRRAFQMKFYEHASHLVLTTESRRMDELRPPYYKGFPFQFLRSNLIVHDLRTDEARLLRCEWYDEQVFWGVRRFEDVSLAFVLAKRRVRGIHGPDEDGWSPLMAPADDEMEVGDPIRSSWGAELFIRILSKPLSSTLKVQHELEVSNKNRDFLEDEEFETEM